MVLQTQPLTIEAFDKLIVLPENIDRNFEFINGEMVEKMVSSPRSSAIGAFLTGMLTAYVYAHGLGRVTGADGGYMVAGEKYIPDAAYISKARQPVQPTEAYNPLAPDLAIEVISPTDNPDYLRLKVVNYLMAGTVVWVANPNKPQLEVYIPGKPTKVLGLDDILEGGELLPDFRVPVKDIFAV